MINEAYPPQMAEGGAAPLPERAADKAALPPDTAAAELAAPCAGLAAARHGRGTGAGPQKKYNQTDKET